jgi:hypothetical protein
MRAWAVVENGKPPFLDGKPVRLTDPEALAKVG